MVNSIINAVTKQLGTTFGDSYRYYAENVEQGLHKDCFTITARMPLQRSRSPVLYDRTIPIVVHYFCDSKKNLKNKCYEMAEQVVECLEYLPFKDTLLRGEDISWQIIEDDVLQVFITYGLITQKVVEEEDAPETLTNNVGHT